MRAHDGGAGIAAGATLRFACRRRRSAPRRGGRLRYFLERRSRAKLAEEGSDVCIRERGRTYESGREGWTSRTPGPRGRGGSV